MCYKSLVEAIYKTLPYIGKNPENLYPYKKDISVGLIFIDKDQLKEIEQALSDRVNVKSLKTGLYESTSKEKIRSILEHSKFKIGGNIDKKYSLKDLFKK